MLLSDFLYATKYIYIIYINIYIYIYIYINIYSQSTCFVLFKFLKKLKSQLDTYFKSTWNQWIISTKIKLIE